MHKLKNIIIGFGITGVIAILIFSLNSKRQIDNSTVSVQKRNISSFGTAVPYITSQVPAVDNSHEQFIQQNMNVMLDFMKFGTSHVSKEEFQTASKIAGENLMESYHVLRDMIKATTPSEVQLRANLYSAIAQIVAEAKDIKSDKQADFVSEYKELVTSELHHSELIVNHEFDGQSTEYQQELTHLQPFKIENGQLYSISLPAKSAALYVLGLTQNSTATNELKNISLNSNYDNSIRETAAHLIDSKLFN